MITYLSKKTGERYPQCGVASWFKEGGWSDSKNKATEHHIKPGYKDCTNGWKKIKVKNWTQEEIPDLEKGFTKERFKEYATKYGLACAQEFLDTCDYMKPMEAFRMFNPTKNAEIWENEENQAWFIAHFKTSLYAFIEGYSYSLANTYSLDILKFEKYLAREFGYPMREDGSMKDFMIEKFGKDVVDKFIILFLPSLAQKKMNKILDEALN
jgi:hypothetical protein